MVIGTSDPLTTSISPGYDHRKVRGRFERSMRSQNFGKLLYLPDLLLYKMAVIGQSLTVLGELRDFIVPLDDGQLFQLEKNILAEGCREPIIIWKHNNKFVIVDGHNRYGICRKNKLPFKTKQIAFKNFEDAKAWMIDNQMGRRNLTPDQLSYYRGVKYLALRKKKGGYGNVKSKGQNEITTSEMLANQFTVSESTVKRDAKFAEGLNIVGSSNPKLKNRILTGQARVNKADLQVLGSAKYPEKITIKNEADLYNKAKMIRDDLANEIEAGNRRVKQIKVDKAVATINEKEPTFLSREDRLRKTKARILSALNEAIRDRDPNAISVARALVDQLAKEILY